MPPCAAAPRRVLRDVLQQRPPPQQPLRALAVCGRGQVSRQSSEQGLGLPGSLCRRVLEVEPVELEELEELEIEPVELEELKIEPVELEAIAGDTQQLGSIDPWYRSGGVICAPALRVRAAGRS